ncbi:choice-of-anchor I family protein [Staphylococcus equorum]|uniref:choice-of-anchor I family protein n=1 Tax=Staphylococcus equorum TaxID=246432 RepID=UPI00255488E7|nr:choice-of-anchor I family protein [Staphylococcus equorum]MDK9861213.1 choice-of-anchor I family protein [Staphylococcus equorum]
MFNNTKRNTIYSIRKGMMGTASVTIGTCLLLGMSNQASADEHSHVKNGSETTTAQDQTSSQNHTLESPKSTPTDNHNLNNNQAANIHNQNEGTTEEPKEETTDTNKQDIKNENQSPNTQSSLNNSSDTQKPEQPTESDASEEQTIDNNAKESEESITEHDTNKDEFAEQNTQKSQQHELLKEKDKKKDSNVENSKYDQSPKSSSSEAKQEQVQKNDESKQSIDQTKNSKTSTEHSKTPTEHSKTPLNESEAPTDNSNTPNEPDKSTINSNTSADNATSTTQKQHDPANKSVNKTEDSIKPTHKIEDASTESQFASEPLNNNNENSDAISSNSTSTKKLETLTNEERATLLKAIQHDTQEQDKQPKAVLQMASAQNPTIRNTRNASKDSTSLNINHTGRYDSGAGFDKGGTEIVKYNPKNVYAYSINGDKEALDILDIKNTKNKEIQLVNRIYLQDAGIEAGDLTSVAVHPNGNYIALSEPAKDKTKPGHVVFYSDTGKYLNDLTVGSLPDMVTFTKDGTHLLVANEGEPSDDYKVNPEGSVSIIDTSGVPAELNNSHVRTTPLTQEHMNESIRELGPNKSEAYLNLEPEYIVTDDSGKYAYVTIQESNAIAKLDIENGEFVQVQGLPYKDHSLPENAIDPSDKDGIKELRPVPVLGMLQPDGIDSYEYNGETYLLIANEGDSQDYEGYSEEVRVKDIKDDIELDAKYYEGYTQEELDALVANGLFDDDQLGRLKVTTSHKFRDENGKYNALVTFSGRSFSILKGSDLSMVYDSGNDIEQRIKDILPERFNANYEDFNELEVDGRSDDKGPEVESIEVGTIGNQTYAFVGLERVGGVMIYNITNPTAPEFTQYLYDEQNKDVSPEGITFVSAEDSPTGKPMLIVSFELSGTTSTFELDEIGGSEQAHPNDQDNTKNDNPPVNDGEDNDTIDSNDEKPEIEHHSEDPLVGQNSAIENPDALISETPSNVRNDSSQLNNNSTVQSADFSTAPVDAQYNNTMKNQKSVSQSEQPKHHLATETHNQNGTKYNTSINKTSTTNTILDKEDVNLDKQNASNDHSHSTEAQQLPNTGQSQSQLPLWVSLILGACLLLIGRKQRPKKK